MTGTVAISLPEDDLKLRTSTIGFPLPHVEIKVVDPDTMKTMPIGNKGEVLVRGYLTMIGYHEDFDQSQKVMKFSLISANLIIPT